LPQGSRGRKKKVSCRKDLEAENRLLVRLKAPFEFFSASEKGGEKCRKISAVGESERLSKKGRTGVGYLS